jgi:quaternary ammonium compound-resistance protein SugE
MPWIFLLLAGFMEVAWAVFLKQADGFTKLGPSVAAIVFMIGSVILLSLSLKSIPLGTAYAIWTGIGALGTAILSIAIFKEPAPAGKIVCMVLIGAGIVGLKLFSKS